MSDFGINPLGGNVGASTSGLSPKQETSGPSFSDVIKRSINEVAERQEASDQAMEDLATGRRRTLHEAMIQMEKADISFKLLMAVRTKLVSAYQEISRMNF